MNGRGSIPEKAKIIYVLQCKETGSGTHPVSYPMGIGGSFQGVKAGRA
jgi:hypothetical protein